MPQAVPDRFGLVDDLRQRVEALWEQRSDLAPGDPGALAVIEAVLDRLDDGRARVAEIDATSDEVVVHEWLRRAILLSFRLYEIRTIELGPFEYADRLELKHGFAKGGIRAVPGASVRRGAYVGPGAVLMPSYVNIGARVGASTMVDTWATVGSCAQIGERVHLSGGVGIGGVLEPENAKPVVVEDDALIGSRSMITQGARVGAGAVLGEGTLLNPSIPVIDSFTGDELSRGHVPPWCVAVSATRPRTFTGGEFGLPCVLVVRRLEGGERHDKAQLNAVLREHGVQL